MLRNPITPLDPILPTAASDMPDPDLPDPDLPDPELPDPDLPDPDLPDPDLPNPDLPNPDLPDPDLPGDPPYSPIMDSDVPTGPPSIDPPADQPRLEHAVAALDDRSTDNDREPEEKVRPAGPDQMDLPPEEWDQTDEESDESFPASDPPGNY